MPEKTMPEKTILEKTIPANTPSPPYYAVIFTSLNSDDRSGYDDMAEKMIALAAIQPGFLGVESASGALVSGEPSITVSYWADLESIQKWKMHTEHQKAQEKGKNRWYAAYKTRIAKVERDYSL